MAFYEAFTTAVTMPDGQTEVNMHLVEMEPRMLFEDIGEGLAALRELWPEEAFRASEAENPFFAEELALAIKALNGKGSETPRR